MEDAIFSALHISDFHFGADTSQTNIKTAWDYRRTYGGFRGFGRAFAGPHLQTVHDPDIAQAAAKFILKTFEPGCLVILSGDVAATGADADLQVAAEFLYGDPRPRLPFLTQDGHVTIARGGYEVALVPGNHDRYVDDWGLPGSIRFDHFFARHWTGGTPVKVGVMGHALSDAKLAIVAADFCLPAGLRGGILNPQRYGHGLARQATVDLLRTETDGVRRRHPGVGVCWLIHFPPSLDPGDIHPDLELIDDHLVEQAARSLGIELIIAGHIHRSVVLARGGLQVACAGSATCSLEVVGNYIHYLEIAVSPAGSATLYGRQDFKWSNVTGEFEHLP